MKKPREPGLSKLVQNELELERILALIPEEHRSVRFERVLSSCNPQENTRMLELGFAVEWAMANAYRDQLGSILAAEVDDPRLEAVPKTAREWEVAHLVAASIVRWLPTSVGCSFLQEAFKQGGGSMSYELPNPKRGMPPLPQPVQTTDE